MKFFMLFLLLLPGLVLGQATNPNDTLKIGQGSSASDKGLIFDTNDGVSNKKLTIEKTSKLLKFDGNSFQLGDGSGASDKELIINGTSGKSLKYNGTSDEFELNDGLKLGTAETLKVDSIDSSSGTETLVEQKLRVSEEIYIGPGDHQLRVDNGNLEFSNDGALFKKIGSGSGNGSGGINILVNSSFEDGLTPGWTNSGGTWSQEDYTNAVEGDAKFAQLIASGSGQYFESDLTAIPDNLGAGCQAQMQKYATATDAAWKIVVLDSGANVLSEQNLPQSGGASTFIASPILSFPCPAAGQTAKLRIESLAAATIKADLAYLGGNKNTVDIAQARMAGESHFPGQSSCTTSTASTSLVFLSNANCLAPTIVSSSLGTWLTTDSDGARQIINNLPKGKYTAVFSGVRTVQTTGGNGLVSIGDGTTTCDPINTGNDTANQNVVSVSCTFNYSNSGNRTFSLLNATSANTTNLNNNVNTANAGIKFQLFYWPDDSQSAVTSEQSGWFIDANIGGANPSLGTANQSSYIGIEDAGLDMVLRNGSASAEIGCSSTNAPSGLVCSSGSESVSVAWTPPTTGWFDVCFDFSHNIQTAASGVVYSTFQVVETATNAQTITSEGGSRLSSRSPAASSNSTYPFKVCGSFYASSISKKMHRLFYEQSVVATVTDSRIDADRGAANGQRDIRVTVRPNTTNMARPVLTGDQVTTPGVVNPTLASALISATGVVSDELGDYITSCTNANPFVCTFNSYFSSGFPVNCFASSADSSTTNERSLVVSASSSSGATIYSTAANALSQRQFRLFCHGVKQ